MKVAGNINKFYYYSFPMQAALVTCNNEKNETNIITIAWHSPISKKPPLYGISVAPSRYSHDLIKKSGEFAINFTPLEIINKLHFCGTNSGRNTDKVKETDLSFEQKKNFKTPIIKECYAHLLCSLYEELKLGDHTFFIGQVEQVLAEEQAFEDDLIDNLKVKPCYYRGGNTYTTIDHQQIEF